MRAPAVPPWLARVAALARRDAIVELSYQFQFVLRIGSMLVVTASLHFAAKLVRDPPELARYDATYFDFVVVGLVVATFAATGLASFARSVADEQRIGTLESVLVTPTSLATYVAGSLVVPFALSLVQSAVYLAAAVVVFGGDLELGALPAALPFFLLTVTSFCAFGLLSGAFIVLTKRGDPVSLVLAQATTYFSGALFPTELLPGPVEALTRLVPAYWGLEGLRRSLLGGEGLGDLLPELGALAGLTLLTLPLALAVFARAVRVARRTGTLATY